MNKPKTKNLTAWVTGRNLNVFQKADAVIEYNKLLDYVSKLEKAISVIQCCMGKAEQLPKNNCTLNRQTCGKGSACKYPHCHIQAIAYNVEYMRRCPHEP